VKVRNRSLAAKLVLRPQEAVEACEAFFQVQPADSDTVRFLFYRGWLGGRKSGALALFSAT
jgi:hypothetical protein